MHEQIILQLIKTYGIYFESNYISIIDNKLIYNFSNYSVYIMHNISHKCSAHNLLYKEDVIELIENIQYYVMKEDHMNSTEYNEYFSIIKRLGIHIEKSDLIYVMEDACKSTDSNHYDIYYKTETKDVLLNINYYYSDILYLKPQYLLTVKLELDIVFEREENYNEY